MTEIHPYFVAKARQRMAAAGGDPANAGPLAEWARDAKRIGDARRGVIVAEDGELVAATMYHPGTNSRPGVSYVEKADVQRWGLNHDETGLATAELERVTGRRLVHVTMPEVCRGAGKFIQQVADGSHTPDPLAPVKRAAARSADAAQAVRQAVADAYTWGATPTELGRAAGVNRVTIYRWLKEAGFTMGSGDE